MYEWAAVEFFVYGDYHGSYSFHENTVLFIMPCYPAYIVETSLRVTYCSIHLTEIQPCVCTVYACQQPKPDANHGGWPGSPSFPPTKVFPEVFHPQEQFRGSLVVWLVPEATCWPWPAIQSPAQASEAPHCFCPLQKWVSICF